jgi:hypothetical protein
MKEINLTEMSSAQLSELISKAAAELAKRCATGPEKVWKEEPAKPLIAAAPSAADQNFVMVVLTAVKNGRVVRAADKDSYSAIAKAYPDWFAHKKYPPGLRSGNESRFKEFGILR